MTPPRPPTPPPSPQAEDLFAAALAVPLTDRSAWLRARCGDDAHLLRELESLLAHHEADGSFLEAPASRGLSGDPTPSPAFAGAAPVPERIGPYRVLSLIGEGGMGLVYRAEQDSPRREVAIKVLRTDVTSASAARRFAQEGAVLGRLQHPGIAQVFEAGTDPATGRAFLAIELIDGKPLTDWVSTQPTRERLELIARVCDAVHHAHSRGIVHRDLKPGNILVTAGGQPKVLDFGVAAMLNSQPAATMHTRTGELIGTVAYMSPEQIGGEASHIDTRADIYSLGVILFEALTGRLPHDVRKRPLPEAIRMVREADPTRLSTISREFRGDLDTIAGKALERDPARRYASAAELAADIRRSLADEPITARRPSATYQLGKLARRYKIAVAAGAVVLVTMVAALVSVSISLVNARQAEHETRREAERAERVSEFLTGLLTGIDPGIARGKDTQLLGLMLSEAEQKVGELAANPRAEVQVRTAIGQAYLTISKFNEALNQLEKSLKIAQLDLPKDDELFLKTQQLVASTLDRMDRRDEAMRLTLENAAGWERVQGPAGTGTLLARNNFGKMLTDLGRYAEAEPYLRETIARYRGSVGVDNQDTLRAMSNLGSALCRLNRFDEAEPLLREVLERRTALLGEDHPDTLIVMGNLGHELQTKGRMPEAESLLRQALDVRRRVMGDEHLETIVSMYNMASMYMETNRVEPAAELAERLSDVAPRVLGDAHGLTAATYHMLGRVRRSQKRPQDALPAQLLAIEVGKKAFPANSPRHGIFLCAAGRTCIDLGRLDEAERLLTDGLAAIEKTAAAGDRTALTAIEMFIDLAKAKGDPAMEAKWSSELATRRAVLEPPANSGPGTGGGGR